MTHRKKILFANAPFDGHFNPLLPLALHLQAQGHDVRWYASSFYGEKILRHGIPFYSCEKALDITQENLNTILPERLGVKGQVGRLKFDLKHVFILRSVEYFEDIKNISKSFDFDLMIADICFTASPFVRHKLDKPVINIGIMPLPQSSVDLPPSGLGMTPSNGIAGKWKQQLLRMFTDKMIFAESKKLVDELYARYNMKPVDGNIFDVLCKEATLVLQSGTPGFEYYRSDLGKNIRFIGPLLPLKKSITNQWDYKDRKNYSYRVLVTQGTVEKNPEKLLVPTLEAFKKNKDVQVIVTTGGSFTKELRERYKEPNIIIEDFIPFETVMPYMDVYVTNGGYGGVLLSIQNTLPMVVAGVHEGKNEICARVGYFKLGKNLKTENPTAAQVLNAVAEVTGNPVYKTSIAGLQKEFAEYSPFELLDLYVDQVLERSNPKLQPHEMLELEAAW